MKKLFLLLILFCTANIYSLADEKKPIKLDDPRYGDRPESCAKFIPICSYGDGIIELYIKGGACNCQIIIENDMTGEQIEWSGLVSTPIYFNIDTASPSYTIIITVGSVTYIGELIL